MRREGSPWSGLWAVVSKEAADHLTSARMRFLEVLVGLAAIGAVYAATQTIRQTVGSDPFLFLTLFTTAKDPLPSFVSFLGFLVPLQVIQHLHRRGARRRWPRGKEGRPVSAPQHRVRPELHGMSAELDAGVRHTSRRRRRSHHRFGDEPAAQCEAEFTGQHERVESQAWRLLENPDDVVFHLAACDVDEEEANDRCRRWTE